MNNPELMENNNNQEIESKEKKIQEELKRISVHYADLDEEQKAILAPLLQNAAFMRVTLEDLQQLIIEEGVTDVYQNGANQHGRKQSASLQAYNALVKNYASVTKTLSQMLPPRKKESLPPVILGKTLLQWKFDKDQEANSDPSILFMSLEEWLQHKLEKESETSS